MGKSAVNPIVSTPEISKNGLTVTGDIEQVEQIFPDVVENISTFTVTEIYSEIDMI